MMYVFENEYACSSVYFQIPIVAFLNKAKAFQKQYPQAVCNTFLLTADQIIHMYI